MQTINLLVGLVLIVSTLVELELENSTGSLFDDSNLRGMIDKFFIFVGSLLLTAPLLLAWHYIKLGK